jgi:amino acid transporter
VAITGIMEVLVLLVGSIIIIIKVGAANSFVPFTIPNGTLSLVLFGVIFSILDFTGLGTVTTVSEEITEPRKKIRKALVIAWLLSGVALIPASYALTVGWGIPNIGSYASSPDPGLIVFQRYLGPVGLILLAVFTINSYFSYGVAKTNAVSRIWFSAARDGVLFPKSLGKVHPKHRTPSNAMIVWLGTSFVLDMVLGFIFGPLTAGLVLLSMAGIAIIFVHVFANTGLTIFSYRELRAKGESNFLYHYLAPTVSSILGLIVVAYSIQSAVTTYIGAPNASNLSFLVAPVLGVVWCLGIGGALSFYYRSKKKEILMGAGRYDSEQVAV